MADRTEREMRKLSTTWVEAMRLLLPESTSPVDSDPRWNCRHLTLVMVLLTDTLQTLDVSATQRPMELWELCRERSLAAHTLIEVARQIEEDSPEDLLPQASSLLSTVEERLTGTRPTPARVETLVGPARLTDHLRLTMIDGVCMALASGIALPRAVKVDACRTLATILGQTHGGRTIELRVPPATAVQLESTTAGPDHHRGTPPNVAESDMETFLALATGFLSWSQARENGRISTSGSHVEELAEMLPVVDATHRCGR